MKILDRYILRIFASGLLAGGVFVAGLYVLIHFITRVGNLTEGKEALAGIGVGVFGGYCRYYALHLPEVAVIFGPYVVLFATMYALHHLEQNNELVPMYTVGLSRLRVTLPIFLATAVVAAGLVGLKEIAIPGGADDMELYSRLIRGNDEPPSDDVELIQDDRGIIYDCETWLPDERRLVDVFMQDPTASKGRRFSSLQWVGDSGRGHFEPPSEEILPGDLEKLSALHLVDIPNERRRLRRLSFTVLRERFQGRPDRKDIAVALYDHVTYPFTPFVLILMGIPVVMRRRNRHAMTGVAFCLVLSLAFFSATQITQRMAMHGDLSSPLIAAWLPYVLFAAVGVVLLELRD
ncbi:MAG: LptF/LptG family permease [Planctomycetota bacterium]